MTSLTESQPVGTPSSTPIRLDTRVSNGHILCSEKWRGSELISALQVQGAVNVMYEDRLGVVDFQPSNEMGVVYISEGDLVTGVTYKRKLAKLRMAQNVRGLVIAEKTNTSGQYFAGLQRFATLELGLVLLPVTSQTEAARVLSQLVHVENRPQTNQFRLRPKKQPLDGAVLCTLQQIPKLGEVKAKALLEHFHTLEALARASEEDMAAIIGSSAAGHVRRYLDAPS